MISNEIVILGSQFTATLFVILLSFVVGFVMPAHIDGKPRKELRRDLIGCFILSCLAWYFLFVY